MVTGQTPEEFKSTYGRYLHKKTVFIALCIVVAFIAMGIELSQGHYHISMLESYQILWDHITGKTLTTWDEIEADMVVWDMRLPRVLAGLAVGAAFGVCGAAMQSSLKNPLADPYTTGISAGASFGACLAIILGTSILPGIVGETAIVINAFIFALIPALVIILVSTFKKKITSTGMILIGIAVMYVFTAATNLFRFVATDDKLQDLYVWNVGTLSRASWDNVWLMIGAAILGIVAIQYLARRLNVLVMCDQNAITLGVDPKKTRIIVLALVSLVTATMVSFTGTIGFVGLVSPHIARIILGSDNRYLTLASAAFGAMLLLVSDIIAKSAGTSGLPVGTITAIIGGPLFLYLLIKNSKYGA